MKKVLIIIFALASFNWAYAQELNCRVSINSQQIDASDKTVYQKMQKSIYEFMNQTVWTSYSFEQNERIECTFSITLTSRPSDEEFIGNITVQSSRPIYNSSYQSTMINHYDKDLKFSYQMDQPLNFQLNSYTSNLTSILSYYAYIIIGLDFDSYTLYGGSPFYENAQTVLNNTSGKNYVGWGAAESKQNRYWLLENLQNNSYASFRQCIYKYHLSGLDKIIENNEAGRAGIYEALEDLRKTNRTRPGLFIISMFTDAKATEIINVFTEASAMDKPRVIAIMKEVDPANGSKYDKINESN